ncbi:MAG TPA: TIGR04283 family arsenosugar biosynthesis glycosyltransferase [Chthoniobacterales bacterium]|nr:TIGR04283 family arsenosugar biosynthesis glycosyltransferase [Chthoniobacterales bacterium]
MTDPAAAALRLSVIVPAWSERENLRRLVPQLLSLKGLQEVVVVDALPDRITAEEVRQAGGLYFHSTAPNRGTQMNLGAENAAGDVLLFHHADSVLTAEHVAAIHRALRDPGVIGGAFYRKFDRRHPSLRPLEIVARFFTRHGGSFFGDQSTFVRREIFSKLSGFAPIPLMEDIEWSGRLRRAGRVAILDPPVLSSHRRHLSRGPWRTSIENGIFILLYRCGVSPARLHRWYYRERLASPDKAMVVAPPVDEPISG